VTEKSRRVAAASPARNEAFNNNDTATSSLTPHQPQASLYATRLRTGRAVAPPGLRPPPPPFHPTCVISAALKRESRLDERGRACLRWLAARRAQNLSDAERWALCDLADQLNLKPADRG
jgi:hypothetical protein